MDKRLALNILVWTTLLTGLGAAVVYFNPQLMESWSGPALLAAPPVAGILMFLLARSPRKREEGLGEEVKPRPPASPEPKGMEEGQAAEEGEQASPHVPRPAPEEPAPPGPSPEVIVAQFLGLLQREGRFLDFIEEDIDAYDDSQVGAAARQVHRGCRLALEEVLGLGPVIDAREGTSVEVDEDFDPSKIKLVGNVKGRPPFKGILRHSGWRFTRMELPEWTGRARADVVAPAEVEIQ